MSDFWIQTASGVAFDLLEPAPDTVRLDDIAVAFSRLCRFTGHVPSGVYSVAAHSVFVSDHLPPELRRIGLMHDAAEAYVGDVSSPLRRAMAHLDGGLVGTLSISTFAEIERRVWRVIAARFDLPLVLPPEVVEADLRALATERRDLLTPATRRWADLPPPYLAPTMKSEGPQTDYNAFLRRAYELASTWRGL